jgi:hypothetical protein
MESPRRQVRDNRQIDVVQFHVRSATEQIVAVTGQ